MTLEELISKFRDCMAHGRKTIPGDEVERIIELVRHAEELNDVTEIIKRMK
jgi:hypothetical protein